MADDTRDYLINILKQGVAEIVFTKRDGSTREMRCTLHPDYLPPLVEGAEKKERKVNPDVLSVYDVEAKGWRSFRIDSLLEVTENVDVD